MSRYPDGARRAEDGSVGAALGPRVQIARFRLGGGLAIRLLASRVLAMVVYGATPRDPIVLAGAVLAMLLVGVIATWIPAQRALAVDPATLMRED